MIWTNRSKFNPHKKVEIQKENYLHVELKFVLANSVQEMHYNSVSEFHCLIADQNRLFLGPQINLLGIALSSEFREFIERSNTEFEFFF